MSVVSVHEVAKGGEEKRIGRLVGERERRRKRREEPGGRER